MHNFIDNKLRQSHHMVLVDESAYGTNVHLRYQLIRNWLKNHYVDYGIKSDWDCGQEIKYRNDMPIANVYYPVYEKTIKELQYLYGDKISIKMGIEFGMQLHTIQMYEKLFNRYPFDFVILSVHQIDNKEFWTQDFQKGKSQREYNERYYQELLSLVKKYKNYSILGHMDLITRYDENGIYPFKKVADIVEEILKIIISEGKGIEINTSSHRYGLKDLTPSRDILHLYKELGGEIITIGSDSHNKEHLGAYIEDTKNELCNMGYEYYCTYEKMRPLFHMLR
jgi:histidinol-phosphatase (PHP family)